MTTTSPLAADWDQHHVVWLRACDQAPVNLVGRKAADLRRLVEAGYDVPDGFVVTTTAYVDALEQAGVRADLRRLWAAPLPDPADRERHWEKVADLTARVVVPYQLGRRIVGTYQCLDPPGTPLAVRSSPPGGYDGPGFHTSFTDVHGSGELLGRVRDCWIAPHGAAAVSAEGRPGRRHGEPVTAVLVQQMVEADVAGVAGLGVQGELVVEVEPRPGGGAPALGEPRTARLSTAVHGAAELFGRPTTLEWALAGDDLWLLQATPT